MGVPAIEAVGLGKVFRRGALRTAVAALTDLDLTVRRGEIFGFLGQNGAGKTTTIKLLTGLLRPSRGEARIAGEPIGSSASRRALGYLPENPALPPRANVREVVALSATLAGRGSGAKSEAARWIERLDLGAIAGRPVQKLSKGQAQLTALAAAMVGDPDVLVLDEPMSGLDPVARKAVRDTLNDARDNGASVFLSSHILADMELLCDRVGLIRGGRMVGTHSLEDVRETGAREVQLARVSRESVEAIDGVRVLDPRGDVLLLSVEPSALDTVLQITLAQGGRVRGVGGGAGRLEDLVLGALVAEEPAVRRAGGDR